MDGSKQGTGTEKLFLFKTAKTTGFLFYLILLSIWACLCCVIYLGLVCVFSRLVSAQADHHWRLITPGLSVVIIVMTGDAHYNVGIKTCNAAHKVSIRT